MIAALHAQDAARAWSHCDSTVASHFWTPQSVPSIQLFPDLLQTLPILLYAGDRDLMCAGIGIEKTIENLEWDGFKGFVSSRAIQVFIESAWFLSVTDHLGALERLGIARVERGREICRKVDDQGQSDIRRSLEQFPHGRWSSVWLVGFPPAHLLRRA